jgi:hypothetical protein
MMFATMALFPSRLSKQTILGRLQLFPSFNGHLTNRPPSEQLFQNFQNLVCFYILFAVARLALEPVKASTSPTSTVVDLFQDDSVTAGQDSFLSNKSLFACHLRGSNPTDPGIVEPRELELQHRDPSTFSPTVPHAILYIFEQLMEEHK